jgi:hypothetical protein
MMMMRSIQLTAHRVGADGAFNRARETLDARHARGPQRTDKDVTTRRTARR